ncbi:MAG: serine protease, partial [Verrucomicrobiota bacterium]
MPLKFYLFQIAYILLHLSSSLAQASQGTGFFIHPKGFLITNYHVIENAQNITVKYNNSLHSARVVSSFEEVDLALLKADVESVKHFVDVKAPKPAALADEVYTVGFPNIALQGISPKYTDGVISSRKGFKDDPNTYQISVPIQPGNSGGALISKNSRQVVGVVVSKMRGAENVAYAIKGKYVAPLASMASLLG